MGSRVGSGFRFLTLCPWAHAVSISVLGLVAGCGGGNGDGLFGGNDGTDASATDTSQDDAGTAETTTSQVSGNTSSTSADTNSDISDTDGSGETQDTSGAGTSSNTDLDAGSSTPTAGDESSSSMSSSTNDGGGSGSDTTSSTASSSNESSSSSGTGVSSDSDTSSLTPDSGSTDSSTTTAEESSTTDDTSDPTPTCEITTPSKLLLNGVAAPEGDRASTSGAYAIRVEVATSQPNGSLVLLAVSEESPRVATVQAGQAVFQLVTLPEGTDSSLQATCQGAMSVQSDTLIVTVDAQPPVVDVANVSPTDAQQLLPSDDRDPEAEGTNFDVCVPVNSSDALDIGIDNVCVTMGANQNCAEATSDGVSTGINGACVRMQCEGATTFDLDVVVADEAGNPTTLTVADVQCATSNLLVQLVDRRQTSFSLDWTPATQEVSGYEVAYTKVSSDDAPPIDADSFDDATNIQVVGGSTHSLLLEDLTIEQRYHFAVRPILVSEDVAPVTATPTPLRAQFQTQVLAPPANSEGNQWGYSVDASGDVNGDGAADLVVGQSLGDRVTIYFGHLDGAFSTDPDVTINGPTDTAFGVSAALVGKVQGDDVEYLAIAATNFDVNGRVYLLATTALDQAVIDLTDGNNAFGSVVDFPDGPATPLHVARLGDFDGDAVDDFAIHAPSMGQTTACDPDTGDDCTGALVVVRGGVGLPSTVLVPGDTTWSFAFFPSDFGYYGLDWLLGVSDVDGGRSGVLAAEWQQGISRLVTYDDTQPDDYFAQILDVGEPVFDSVVFDTELGLYPSVLTGESSLAVPMTGGRTSDGVGVVELYGLDATSTFSTQPELSLTALGNNNNAGQVLIGSRFNGRPFDYGLPLFGSETGTPLVLAGRYYNNNLPILYMLRGDTLSALPTNVGTIDVAVVADVAFDLSTVPGLSAEWANGPIPSRVTADWHGGLGFGVHDVNGDGYMDLGITEWNVDSDYTGGIVVLY